MNVSTFLSISFSLASSEIDSNIFEGINTYMAPDMSRFSKIFLSELSLVGQVKE